MKDGHDLEHGKNKIHSDYSTTHEEVLRVIVRLINATVFVLHASLRAGISIEGDQIRWHGSQILSSDVVHHLFNFQLFSQSQACAPLNAEAPVLAPTRHDLRRC